MNFRHELAEAVIDGRKTQTRRATSTNPRSPWFAGGCRLVVGRDYAVCPGRGKNAVGRVVVEAVDKVRLGDISHADAQAEGFRDVQAFCEAWEQINGGWLPDDVVWRITFRRKEDA